MLNRYSLVFYLAGFIFLLTYKDIIGFILFTIFGFIAGYFYSRNFISDTDSIDEPLTFDEIKLFEDKNELLKAIKEKDSIESKENPNSNKISINIKDSLIYILLLIMPTVFLFFIYNNYFYFLTIGLIPFLISIKKEV